MKKSNALVLLYFALIFMAASLASCSSSQHGYNYKAHAKKSGHGPSKCYKQHNKW